jgi:hypothetical protein
MNIPKLLITVILVFHGYATTTAQENKACEIDYSPVQIAITPKPVYLSPGNELTLSAQYLAALRAGTYDDSPSGMSHFVYLRPASRKELKADAFSPEYEIVTQENDVFGLTPTLGSNHFFRPDEHFKGDFRPEWKDPVMIVPLGLNPVDITEYAHKSFKVQEYRFNYILLDVEGDYLVFYPGFPETYEVFNSPELQTMLAERKAWGESLVGKRLIVENSPQLRYRLSPHGKDLKIPTQQERMEIFVNSLVVDRSQMLLEYGMDEPLYLVMDQYSDFELLDAECMEKHQAQSIARREAEDQVTNRRLAEVIVSDDPVAELLKDEWLQKRLAQRFQLSNSRSGQKALYEYLLLDNRNLKPTPTLKVKVNETGDLILRSIYVSQDGLYHTRVELDLNDQSYTSERVSNLDSRSRRRRIQGNIVEAIEYLPGGDQGILEAVALNYQQAIEVRYVALGTIYEKHLLDDVHKVAIRDAWLFSQLIQNQKLLHAKAEK